MTNTKEEQVVWDDFFCTLVGWTMHPGYYRENAFPTKPTHEECADMATKMMEVRRSRMKSEDVTDDEP